MKLTRPAGFLNVGGGFHPLPLLAPLREASSPKPLCADEFSVVCFPLLISPHLQLL
jgi:hypothetical protein